MLLYDVLNYLSSIEVRLPLGGFFVSKKFYRGFSMSQELQNILWMAEELDFRLPPKLAHEAEQHIANFLESAANPALNHRVYPA